MNKTVHRIAAFCSSIAPGLWSSLPVGCLRLLYSRDYEQLQYGLPRRTCSLLKIRANNYLDIDRPVFFLSTGRCGTKFFSQILARDRSLAVVHAPKTRLSTQARLAFDLLTRDCVIRSGTHDWRCLRELLLAARERSIFLSHQAGKRFIETNHHITFFAPILAETFPNSLFIHLHRHPGEYIRSGISRKWYLNGECITSGRILPRPESDEYEQWKDFSSIQKIGWLWRDTNLFIEQFKKSQPSGRVFSISINSLKENKVDELLQFVQCRVARNSVIRAIRSSSIPNAQRTHSFPVYSDWNTRQKQQLQEICEEVSNFYGYML